MVALLVEEPTTNERRRLIQDPVIVTWWGSWIECESALNRLRRERHIESTGLEIAHKQLDRLRSSWQPRSRRPRKIRAPSSSYAVTKGSPRQPVPRASSSASGNGHRRRRRGAFRASLWRLPHLEDGTCLSEQPIESSNEGSDRTGNQHHAPGQTSLHRAQFAP